jgi:hypothetical protein
MHEMRSLAKRTSVIVIRLWREPDHTDGLRARITSVPDVEEKEVEREEASSVEAIVEIVKRFVTSLTLA